MAAIYIHHWNYFWAIYHCGAIDTTAQDAASAAFVISKLH